MEFTFILHIFANKSLFMKKILFCRKFLPRNFRGILGKVLYYVRNIVFKRIVLEKNFEN